jgi:hypothetical protein
MAPLKNIRQERFCQQLAAGLPAVRAYEAAGYKAHQSSSSRLRWFAMVQERLAEIQAEHAVANGITVSSLLNELEQARAKATDLNQLSAAVRATSEKAKISGLLVERAEVKVIEEREEAISPQQVLSRIANEIGEDVAEIIAQRFGVEDWREIRLVPATPRRFQAKPALEWRPPAKRNGRRLD